MTKNSHNYHLVHQRGYGGIEWIIFAAFLGLLAYFFLFPMSFPTFIPGDESNDAQFCRPYLNDDGSIKDDAPEIMVPTYDASVVRRGQPFPKLNPNDLQPFRLIKARVPLKSSDLHNNYSKEFLKNQTQNEFHCDTYVYNGTTHSHFCQWIHEPITVSPNLGGGYKYVVMYPAPYSDGNTTDRFIGASDPFLSEVGADQVVRYGTYNILFLLHVDENFDPVVIARATQGEMKGFPYFAFDIYQQVKADDHSQPVSPVPENVVKCLDDTNAESGLQLGDVMESSPDKKQQQLGWFVPSQVVIQDSWYEPACKPAINLYPPFERFINVKVDIPHGFLTYTDPLYPNDTGWNVIAKPDGSLQYLSNNLADSNGSINYPLGIFPYLYYEGKLQDTSFTKPTEGFSVASTQLSGFFDTLLPQLGLNSKEQEEFKAYWLKALPTSPYYFISIIPQEQIEKNEPLTITPKEDSMIRVRLYFEMIDKPRFAQQPLIQPPQRNGFTVVDWGGMVKQDKNHPFTCVQ